MVEQSMGGVGVKANSIGFDIPVLNSGTWEGIRTCGGDGLRRNYFAGDMRKLILVLGQDQLTPKAFYYARELTHFGIDSYFLSDDRLGLSRENIEKHQLHATMVPRSTYQHLRTATKLVRKLRPQHIEVFDGVRSWFLAYYALLGQITRTPIVTWCRGFEILYWKQHHPVRRWALHYLLRTSKAILLRELYMLQIIKEHNIVDASKLWLCHNSISMPPEPADERGPIVLFMNSFKSFRNVHLVVEAARIVVEELPDVRFDLVGSISHLPDYIPGTDDQELILRNRIAELGLEDRVRILPFSNNTKGHLERAAIFLLPADIVFCNYSLLEAMAMKVVPIVSDVEGSDLIVEHGVSGFIEPRDPLRIAERVKQLLHDDALRREMGNAARQAVSLNFNAQTTARNLATFYATEIWNT